MKKSSFTEAQIAFILKQAEDGTAIGEVCRKAGISDATFYNWRKKYAGLMPSEMRRLRQLEEENLKLKRIVADLSSESANIMPGDLHELAQASFYRKKNSSGDYDYFWGPAPHTYDKNPRPPLDKIVLAVTFGSLNATQQTGRIIIDLPSISSKVALAVSK